MLLRFKPCTEKENIAVFNINLIFVTSQILFFGSTFPRCPLVFRHVDVFTVLCLFFLYRRHACFPLLPLIQHVGFFFFC